MGRGIEKAGRWRLIAFLVLLAFGFQSYVTQTHIHDSAAPGASTQIHHPGHGKSPVENSPLDCPFCQMLTHAGSFLMPDAALVLAAPQGMEMAAPLHRLVTTRAAASHAWRSRAPPSL